MCNFFGFFIRENVIVYNIIRTHTGECAQGVYVTDAPRAFKSAGRTRVSQTGLYSFFFRDDAELGCVRGGEACELSLSLSRAFMRPTTPGIIRAEL